MKRVNHFTTYKKWMKSERMTIDRKRFPLFFVNYGNKGNGLCYSVVKRDENFELFTANESGFWAFGIGEDWASDNDLRTKFTPLRQNIVLFLAAIRNQL
jgi:hypothetical protein